jgi:hypothetical protein
MKSKQIIKNHVRFKSDFNKEAQDEIPGRDLAEFLAEQLRGKKYVVNSVDCEEPWFTINVISGSIQYLLMISINYENKDYWEVSCPRTLGFFARLRGKSEDTELQNLVNTLDEILQGEKTITGIKWYSDILDLAADYVQRPIAKRLYIAGKYFDEKVFLPLCLIGGLLVLVGGIRYGKESLLLRIGGIVFLLPFLIYLGFIAVNHFVALIYDIKETHRKRTKKKWLRWFVYIVIIAMLVVPFFLGLFHSPLSDWIVNLIFKSVVGVGMLGMLCMMFFMFFSSVLFANQGKKKWQMKLLYAIGSFLILVGFTGFISGFFVSIGWLEWVPKTVEFPLAGIEGIDVDREGNLFVACKYYNRIQVYDPKGDFMWGWSLDDTYAKDLKIRINNENKVEVASEGGNKIDIFDTNGKLLETKKYDEDDTDFFDSFEQKGKHLIDKSGKYHYDVEGLVFPKIIQTDSDGKKKIRKNAFYLFPFQGPIHGWATAVCGVFLITLAEKKTKKKRSRNA